MGKYIDAEILKAEIERRRKICADIAADEENEEVVEYYRGKEFAHDEISSLIATLQQEQQEVDLDALVNEAFDKYSSVDGYGQLAVSFNRAELYSFIKEIARKEETK